MLNSKACWLFADLVEWYIVWPSWVYNGVAWYIVWPDLVVRGKTGILFGRYLLVYFLL